MNIDKIYSIEHLYFELALILNKNYYEENLIPYSIFKLSETELLKKVKCEKINNS
jgi:hypothetical protein